MRARSGRSRYNASANAEHAQTVRPACSPSGELSAGFEIVPIEGRPQSEVAELIAESLIFLAVSLMEGFGLPAAEAMACGSVVVGYDAFGGRDFLRPDVAFPVPTGDVVALAHELEKVIALESSDPEILRARVRAAHELVASRYSPARQELELVRFWRGLLGSEGRAFLDREQVVSDRAGNRRAIGLT